MKIILVNILLVLTLSGFSVEKNHSDFSMKTPAVKTVSNFQDALNRNTNEGISFEEAEFVLTGFDSEYLGIYNEPKTENYKSSYLQENKQNASKQASHFLKI